MTITPPPIARRRLGRYRISRVLGQGAAGIVYEGLDEGIRRRAALKTILLAGDAGEEEMIKRLQYEARAIARLHHPHIVALYELGEDPEAKLPFLALELVTGKDLGRYLQDDGPLELPRTRRIMQELLGALQFAHSKGVVHRDIKPSNVLIEKGTGAVKLTDFGTAFLRYTTRLTRPGGFLGTPTYSAPEQLVSGGREEETPDVRCDVYSAGVLLYELLTGRVPFEGELPALLHQILNERPRPPSAVDARVPRDLDAVVLRALAKDPDDRYASAEAFSAALAKAGSWGAPLRVVPLVWARTHTQAGAGPLVPELQPPAARDTHRLVAQSLTAGGGGPSPEPPVLSPAQPLRDLSRALWLGAADAATELVGRIIRHAVKGAAGGPAADDAAAAGSADAQRRGDPLPAINQEFIFQGHQGRVLNLAVLPDGRLVTGGADGTVRLWDPVGHGEPSVLGRVTGRTLLVVLREGRVAAVDAQDDALWMWDPVHGGPPVVVRNVWVRRRLSDGRLVSILPHKTVRVWDPLGKVPPVILRGYSGSIGGADRGPSPRAELLPDGRIVLADDDGVVSVWDPARPAEPVLLKEHSGPVSSLAVLPDGRLVSSSGDHTVRVWDLARRAATAVLKLPAAVARLAVLPDGRIVSSSSDNAICILDPEERTAPVVLRGHSDVIRGLAVMPDGRIVSCSEDQTIRVWDAAQHAAPIVLEGHAGWVVGVAVLADGRIASIANDGTVRVWVPDRSRAPYAPIVVQAKP